MTELAISIRGYVRIRGTYSSIRGKYAVNTRGYADIYAADTRGYADIYHSYSTFSFSIKHSTILIIAWQNVGGYILQFSQCTCKHASMQKNFLFFSCF